MSKISVLREFVAFMRHEKKYWLLPVALALICFGLLFAFAQSSVIAPFIYTLF